MLKNFSITPMILCGGEGSRLWPLSNPSKPKQFISLPGMSYTLLQSTLIRLKEAEYFNPPIIIVQECFISYVEEQIKQFNIEVGHIIMESQANGTAFAAALATLLINKNSDALNKEMILIMPVDHYLEDAQELFNKIYFLAAKSHNRITIFGLHPQRKETRYGYIQVEKDANFESIQKVSRFVEKPTEEKIDDLMNNKFCYWNSGIFLSGVANFLQEMKNLCPQIYSKSQEALNKSTEISNRTYILPNELSKKESIDTAIIERSDNIFMSVANVKWYDIGYLYSAWEVTEKDKYGNFSSGNTFLMDTQNSYVVSDQKPIAVIGLNDVVVVNTDEAILIADKSSGTNIQNMYYNLKSEVSNNKPWGAFYEIKREKNFAIKKLKIAPFQRTSLQFHHNRSEYLTVIEGSAAVIVGYESYTLIQAIVYMCHKVLCTVLPIMD